MAKNKLDKCSASLTPKQCHDKPFIQAESELIEARLEAIADGLMKLTTLYTSFKEELMSKQQREKFTATGTSEKSR